MRRPRLRAALPWALLALGLFSVAWIAAYPAETFWRARYWLEPDAKRVALVGLMHAVPDGGSWELSNAVRSGDDLLRDTAGIYLRRRGDPRGLGVLVDLCYEYPGGHIKLDPERSLAEAIGADPRIREHRDTGEWWADFGPRLAYVGGGQWRCDP